MSHSKTVVITGASGGIGAELARRLGAQGHRLALAARREPELSAVAYSINSAINSAINGASGDAARAIAVPTDVRRRQDVEALRDRALAAFGHVDVWINNAGRGIGKRVLDLTDEDFDEIMAVNTKSALYGMQAIVPHFKERGTGHLINISSFLGRVPLATFRSVYGAAKAALNSLTANLRMDLQHEHPGVHVSLVMPGMVDTEFASNSLGATSVPPRGGPMKPQTAAEVAEAIVKLIENPVPEIYTNPASSEIARQYYADIAAFEANYR